MTREQFLALLADLRVVPGFDSGGLHLSAPDEVMTPRLLALCREHRDWLVDAALDAIRAGTPPPAPPGTSLCADCQQPCGSALRCAPCASARVRTHFEVGDKC